MADDTLDLVKDLIQTCKDGETGYAHATGVATDPQLKAYFSEQSLERARFGQELRIEAERLGDKPEVSSSVPAVLHRLWFETKATMGLGDHSILNSVEQGEDSAKKYYEKALPKQQNQAQKARAWNLRGFGPFLLTSVVYKALRFPETFPPISKIC